MQTLAWQLTEWLTAVNHVFAILLQVFAAACLGWIRGFEPIHRHLNTLLVPEMVMVEDGNHREEVLKVPFGALLDLTGCFGRLALSQLRCSG